MTTDEFPLPPLEHTQRQYAIAAFSHELRTPLTAMGMVIEMGRREVGGRGGVVLDEELTGMLVAAVDQVRRLADDLQELSRLQRGQLRPSLGPCTLGEAMAAAQALVPHISVDGKAPDSEAGPWDPAILARALSSVMDSVNRGGDGSGLVTVTASVRDDAVTVTFESGLPGGERPLGTDPGFAIYFAAVLLLSMGGTISAERGDHYCCAHIQLPRKRG